MSSIYISAAHKSSGKTMLSIGLCSSLSEDGLNIQPFKKGPDYIDPLWLAKAAGNPCYNLDFFTTPQDEILQSFHHHSARADLSLIEGNKGLYDGMDLHGSDSNAAMANLLQAPVVMVINCNGITRGVAPLLQGYMNFTDAPNIAGVILNQVSGPRHEEKLIAAVKEYTGLPVIGAVRRSAEMLIDERHLGLIPSNEQNESRLFIERISCQVRDQVNLDFFRQHAQKKPRNVTMESVARLSVTCRVGIFKDEAFGFYYADDLQKFSAFGAELVEIDAINDQQLPQVDALFIGGGFPETHMQQLSSNQALMQQIRDFVENDGIVYAECGGLMYLCSDLTWQDKHCKMCGVIPARVKMYEKPQGRGYIKLAETDKMLWSDDGPRQEVIPAHEFHYSRIEGLPDSAQFAYKVLRGSGINGKSDGYIYRNLLASYAHMRSVGENRWVERFIDFIKTTKQSIEVK